MIVKGGRQNGQQNQRVITPWQNVWEADHLRCTSISAGEIAKGILLCGWKLIRLRGGQIKGHC